MTPAFNSLAAFLAMGGYAPYVWTSYGVFFACLGLLTLVSVRQRRQFEAQLRNYWKRAAGSSGSDENARQSGHSGRAFGPVDESSR